MRKQRAGVHLVAGYLCPSDQQYSITRAADESPFLASVKNVLQEDVLLQTLFERFEEMCRRRRRPGA